MAALSELEDGKMHRHQYLVGRARCAEASSILLRNVERLRACSSFQGLHDRIQEFCLPIHGIGVLYCYDVAHRIGQWLNLEPEKGYLHRGTRDGAKYLGLNTSKGALEMRELPTELQRLTPAEVEDFLCVCSDALRALRDGKRELGELGGELGTVGLLRNPTSEQSRSPTRKRPSATAAAASFARATLCPLGPQGANGPFFNSPTVTYCGAMSRRG
jgi:hypothetical protein